MFPLHYYRREYKRDSFLRPQLWSSHANFQENPWRNTFFKSKTKEKSQHRLFGVWYSKLSHSSFQCLYLKEYSQVWSELKLTSQISEFLLPSLLLLKNIFYCWWKNYGLVVNRCMVCHDIELKPHSTASQVWVITVLLFPCVLGPHQVCWHNCQSVLIVMYFFLVYNRICINEPRQPNHFMWAIILLAADD